MGLVDKRIMGENDLNIFSLCEHISDGRLWDKEKWVNRGLELRVERGRLCGVREEWEGMVAAGKQ